MAQRSGGRGRGGGGNPYRRALAGGGSAWARNSQGARANAQMARGGSRSMTDAKQFLLRKGDALDRKFGFHLLPTLLEEQQQAQAEAAGGDGAMAAAEGEPRLGWLLNLRACSILDPTEGKFEVSAVELYFLEQDGKAFKTRVVYQPYLYVRPEEHRSQEVIAYCLRRFDGLVAKAERVLVEDLDLPNHLSGKQAAYVKLSFFTVADLVSVKQALAPLVEQNQQQQRTRQAYELQGQAARDRAAEDDTLLFGGSSRTTGGLDASETALLELREYDVPYAMRVAIDLDIRVGAWYHVTYDPAAPFTPSDVTRLPDMVDKAEPVVCAFDIETTKLPLKFPDASFDQIYMISYMVDRQGYLIVNREFVSEDIADFEYTPKSDYPGPFIVFNEPDEKQLLQRFVEHMVDVQPHIYVTYNGDFFDWPFLDARAAVHGLSLADELGVSLDVRTGEYRGRASVHMDAFCWVKRDSYLPQGSQGLKAVTKYKLGYDPVEVDAEDMLALARDEPLKMASYSVSDAVATFYLYDKYVHLFVFSLCTIIPLGSEDVLRKGSGTLCEALLMVEAFTGGIICPNKQTTTGADETFFKGHLVESETYVGGHVECLESGVFRADFPYDFRLVPSAFESLITNVDRDLRFALEVEMDLSLDRVTNYRDVRTQIVRQLEDLRDRPTRKEKPLIYHLDVAAMYPNIILTNRLQPCAIVNEADCAACVFNTECGKTAVASASASASCQRDMDWVWRGDFYPATRPEYMAIKTQLEYENFPVGGPSTGGGSGAFGRPGGAGTTAADAAAAAKLVPFSQLHAERQETLLKQRVKSYCSSVYKKTKVTQEQTRSATVCMRENPFYVNTVRAFRDRRYDYKALTKTWKRKQAAAEAAHDLLATIDAQTKCLVYDSLQLAHKCILNSFYGYVMRKGARWHSMEMAGIVTHTGSAIITGARELVEQIGRPLELDTDGIWAILPASFPETFAFTLNDGSTRTISYPCVMLNADVQAKFTNPQYHERDPATGTYRTRRECSILFEVDGPYKAMVLPASTEEGRLLKKRYAVFNFDHSLAELKGFELKRRGELQLIKAFQSQVFECFLDGASLDECYASVAQCANRWLDVIDSKGRSMDDDELLTLLTENKSMSGKLDEYAGQKSTSITTAKRLSEFLGESMVKDRGLTCKMIIAAKPFGEKVTERAIPTAIFASEDAVKRHFLKKWLKDPNVEDFDLRSILDWDYYRTRFAATVQKIISLPAAFQNVRNPVPRIELPDWMRKQVREKSARHQQGSLAAFVTHTKRANDGGDYIAHLIDMEDLVAGKLPLSSKPTPKPKALQPKRKRADADSNGDSSSTAAADSAEESESGVASTAGREHDDDDDRAAAAASPPVKLGEVPFRAWLERRKAMWKALLVKRKRVRDERSRRTIAGLSSSMLELGSGALGASATKRHQSMAAHGSRTGVGMENYVLNTASALQRESWQIVEVQQETDGHFTCWVVTSQTQMLHRVTLKMPRVFYLAVDEADIHVLADLPLATRRVMRVVPHLSAKPQSVVEVTVSEQQFQTHHKEMRQILTDPVVKGVYELQVSPLTRAVCSLGCVVKVVNPHLSTAATQEYELSDLQFQSTAQVPYLVDTVVHHELNDSGVTTTTTVPLLRRVLFYFAQQKTRAILGLVVLKDPGEDGGPTSDGCTGDATVWYVDPVSTARARSSELQQHFDQLVQASEDERNDEEEDNSDRPSRLRRCSFKTHVVKTTDQAFAGVNATLARLASTGRTTPSSSSRPTIVVAQTCVGSRKRLREKVQGLHSFPLATLPWRDEDTLFPALTWRRLVGETLVTRVLEMAPDYDDVLACARYAHLPVGNFVGDHALAVLDTLYSRLLSKHKHLWWHSARSAPDLGGREHEEQFHHQLASHSLLTSHSSSTKTTGSSDGPVVCDKGSFPDVCVELELDGLAVNALLVALQVQSLEGVSSGGGTSSTTSGSHQLELDFDASSSTVGATTTDADEPSHEAFRLVRGLVTTLFKDVLASRNPFADHLLQQFYRWVSSPEALCYDPALHALVRRLMEKLFLQLLAELRRLGCRVVYADVSGRLVLSTGKPDVHTAKTHVAFVLQTVLANELFQVLSLRPKAFVAGLLFLDAENYGGVRLGSESDSDKTKDEHTTEAVAARETDQADHVSEPTLDILSHWNMANYLPPGVDAYFLLLVGQFIRRRAEFQQRERAKAQAEATAQAHIQAQAKPQAKPQADDSTFDQQDNDDALDADTQPLAAYSQRLVASYVSAKLLRLVPEIQSYNLGRRSFPVFAGSHLPMEQPALELVKFVVAVLELEPSVAAPVAKLRRTLLKLLRVSEFSDVAAFANPSLSFVVPDVICLACNLCRAVDLCRDPQLFNGSGLGSGGLGSTARDDRADHDVDEKNQDGATTTTTTAWHCPRCFALYDKRAFERRLVELVEAQSVQYQLQDVYCRKCLLPAEHAMREYCACSGAFDVRPRAREELDETLRVLRRIAQQHGFEWLLETVQRLELQ